MAKINDSVIVAICEIIAQGVSRDVASVAVGIDKRTLYLWLERGRAGDEAENGRYILFAQMVEQADAEAEVNMVKNITKHSAQSWQASAWMLERTRPKRYGRRMVQPVDDNDVERDEVQVIG